jgi:hypothetical protein
MSSATHSRTAKTLKLLLLASLSGAILLLANGNVCRRTILRTRESVLKKDLATMREAIDDYTADKKRPPESLQALVDERYLRFIIDKQMKIENGGGGSRTPVRKALRHGAYMLISVRLVRHPRLERARNAAG